ncbi:MarR family winged helix-turn-helix transcriptional regulator [Celeribacter indicus]|uniref:MarR family transcriptional regulator n=1 Tax=Celeribacter indicus TaxID=1208324 RepID=A0A0B5DWV6_9RHOB|nr:MarR family winged helix-turn-helix transcriptional regulator [Celeribacter indicus]AJE47938.1 MarR family transcriptional regulator [Celeribacter indicus]SDW27418.1 MarR family protein [Celeribacter indicus]
MTDDPHRFPFDPRVHAGVPDLLDARGFSRGAAEDLLALDLVLFQWRRMAERGEFKGRVLEDMSERLEPAILQGLLSVAQLSAGIGQRAPVQPTIGMVAEIMAVDPSRASRIVSELVSRGYVERRAAQEDARRSVLVTTAKGRRFLDEYTRSKWRIFAEIFDGWEAQDIADFSRLFARYVSRLVEVLARAPGEAK